jgi:autotransporter-associated beta strand protein
MRRAIALKFVSRAAARRSRRTSIGVVALVLLLSSTSKTARAQATLTPLNDIALANNALLMPQSAPYGRAINHVAFQTENFITIGDYQYATWYRALGTSQEDLMLARRNLTSGAIQIMDTGRDLINGDSTGSDGSSAWDAHNVIAMGISTADGRIHLAYDHHNSQLNYTPSNNGAATGAAWDNSVFQAERPSLNDPGAAIGDLTYPRFINSPTGGLVMTYRTGGSGNGNLNLATYNAATGTWSDPRIIINGTDPIFYDDAFGDSSTNRNAYINGVNFDPLGKIHITWTWREQATGSSNHDIMYAYSDDGGTTWRNNSGAVVGTPNDPIDLNSPGITIEPMDRGNTLMNQQAQTVDDDGRVHVVMWHKTDQAPPVVGFTTDPAAYFHYYRDPTSGAWTRTALPTSREVGSRPDVAHDEHGNIYVAYLSPGPGDGVGVLNYYTDGDLVIAGASKAANYTDWSILHTDTRDFAGEPRIDQNRLLNDGVLSVFIQENSDANTSRTATPLHVLEFNVVNELTWAGDDLGVWDTNAGTDWDTNNDNLGNASFVSGTNVRFDDGAATFAVPIADSVTPGATKFSNTASAYTITGAGIAGNGGLTVDGGGTVTLANAANTYTGPTQINSGTLALSGAATIAASPNIDVAAGGTLDVSAVSGGAYTLNNQILTIGGDVSGNIVAANNSTVHVDSNDSMNGNLAAETGSLVAGAGRVAGNLTAHASAVIRVGADGITFSFSQLVIDDFQSYATGDVRDVANPPWTAHANTAFADIESAGGVNKVLTFGTNGLAGVSRDMPAGAQIGTTQQATLFFRFNSKTDDPDHNFGLADQATTAAVDFNDFEAQVRVLDDPSAAGTFMLDARNGSSFPASPLATGLTTDTWYNVWVVVNQNSDTYDVYMNTGAADALPDDRLNDTPLAFRNGNAGILNKILGYANSAPISNGVRYDDLVYFAGEDLTNPLGGLDPELLGSGQTLTVDGDATLTAGATLELDVVSPGIADRMDVGGTFTAGGTLEVTLVPGAPAPQPGDVFDILDFTSASGAFAVFDLPDLSPGLSWNTANLLYSGVLEVVDGLPGDFNKDGTVDAADFVMWQKNDGSPQGYNTWRAHLGMSSPGAGGDGDSPGSVPEPSAVPLLLIGLLAAAGRRKSRCSWPL